MSGPFIHGQQQYLEEQMTKWIAIPFLVCLIGLLGAPAVSGNQEQPANVTVDVRDYCDPATFNAVLGTGECVRDTTNGAITFNGFNTEFFTDKSVGAWRFAPETTTAKEGANLTVNNLGGETHTFTRVKDFGGGFVAFFNANSGNPEPAPECAQTVNGQLVPQPPSATNIFLPAGTSTAGPSVAEGETARFQCCIHPWMRTTIKASHAEHGGDR
jgi:hypothetical protein